MLNIRALALGAFVAGALAQPSLAQSYPSQNVTVIVAFPAGGLADIIGRLVSTKLESRLKQSFVVENRGGAGGNIAAKTVAGAAPEGYTLLATTSGRNGIRGSRPSAVRMPISMARRRAAGRDQANFTRNRPSATVLDDHHCGSR